MNTKEMKTYENRKKAALDDYEKVLKIEPKKPLQIFLVLKWLRQGYESRVQFLKNQCGLDPEEASQQIHVLSTNIVKESGAIVKAIEAGEFDQGAKK